MELEDALFKFVSEQAAITAIIGAPPGIVRFHKLKIPQGSPMPALAQQRSGSPRGYAQCGRDGAVRVSMQIDSYAKRWADMAALAGAVREALDPYPSPYPIWMGEGDSPSTAVRVKSAQLDNEFDLDDPEPGLLRRTQLWSIWIFQP